MMLIPGPGSNDRTEFNGAAVCADNLAAARVHALAHFVVASLISNGTGTAEIEHSSYRDAIAASVRAEAMSIWTSWPA